MEEKKEPIRLYIIVPCYNEEEVLTDSEQKLSAKLHQLIEDEKVTSESRVVFIDDGSKDKTWSLIEGFNQTNPLCLGVKLSRNRGHQNALLGGMNTVKGLADAYVSIDADLQDDINAIDQMVEAYQNGCEVVYGVRDDRAKDSFFKRFTAQSFYKLIHFLGADIVYNHADFRLMSNRALEGLLEFDEVNLFLRGLVPLVGYKAGYVYYERKERLAGESKYPLKKMLAFAFQGITSFSIKPIRFILGLGLTTFFASIIMIVYVLVQHFTGQTVSGWTSLMLSVWVFGSLQLVAIGIVGEYIGKVYLETKHRPRYIIETFLKDK